MRSSFVARVGRDQGGWMVQALGGTAYSRTERPRLLLIEDDLELGPLARDILASVYDVTLESTGAGGARAALQDVADVIVVDRRLGDMDGLEIVARLRAAGLATPVLVLTALGAVRDRVEGLDEGANDYLVKPFDFEELFARLRALRRVVPPEGTVYEIGQWQFYPNNRMVSSPYDGQIALTEAEAALLHLLARNAGRTLSRQSIHRAVFQSGEHPGVVDTYVHYIRRKTDRDIIVTVRGLGYRLGTL